MYKKSQQRLYFVKNLGYFKVDYTVLILFYKSFIESILTFCIVCWFGNTTVSQKNMLRMFRLLALSGARGHQATLYYAHLSPS